MFAIAAFPDRPDPLIVSLSEPTPPGPGEVLCRTVELGICGTDREILASRQPLVPPGADFLALGHECLAEVVAVGEGVDQLSSGDWVVPLVRRPLARAAGHRVDMLSFGDYGERGIVWEHGFSAPRWIDRPSYLIPVPLELLDVAVLTEPLAVAEKGVNEAAILQRARLGDIWRQPPRVLVTGLGPIGLAAVLACSARNWPVTVFGRDRADTFRADLVRRLGGEYVSADTNGWAWTTDRPDEEGFDLILECTGNDHLTLSAARRLASRGVMVWLGSMRRMAERPHAVSQLMRDGILRNHLHVGSVNAAPRDFRDALKHLADAKARNFAAVADLITKRVSPADSLVDFVRREPQGVKVVLDYRDFTG
ncbi:MAG: alcohol dehydrogenase catalytic domain-containing protein [Pirellulaceae bacterium]|jgi:threonine dehydrogenase-like Zn-dependent dehydrogenase|nr:alcohol dehydrogenase catalytic domain-containing protein [Pirellulaceae bacterium]